MRTTLLSFYTRFKNKSASFSTVYFYSTDGYVFKAEGFFRIKELSHDRNKDIFEKAFKVHQKKFTDAQAHAARGFLYSSKLLAIILESIHFNAAKSHNFEARKKAYAQVTRKLLNDRSCT